MIDGRRRLNKAMRKGLPAQLDVLLIAKKYPIP